MRFDRVEHYSRVIGHDDALPEVVARCHRVGLEPGRVAQSVAERLHLAPRPGTRWEAGLDRGCLLPDPGTGGPGRGATCGELDHAHSCAPRSATDPGSARDLRLLEGLDRVAQFLVVVEARPACQPALDPGPWLVIHRLDVVDLALLQVERACIRLDLGPRVIAVDLGHETGEVVDLSWQHTVASETETTGGSVSVSSLSATW